MRDSNISILGCGWLGLPLAISLISDNFNLKGSTRSPKKNTVLAQHGISPFCIDISNKEHTLSDFLNSKTLICALPTKDIEAYKRLISSVEKSTIENVLFISATSVYAPHPNPITEEFPTTNSDLAIIEQLFLKNQKFNTTILRFGGLIGPDRNPGNFFKKGRMIKAPNSPVNLIHRDDCIRIIHQIIQQNCWNTVLNACTDTHPSKREFYGKMTSMTHQAPAQFEDDSESPIKIISNKKIKEKLHYSFKFKELMHLSLSCFESDTP